MHYYTKLYFLLFFCFFGFVAHGQMHTISGYITDIATGETLINANIYETQNYKGTTSNEYGFYSITLPEGGVELAAAYVGYKNFKQTLQLKADTVINIQLDIEILNEVVIVASSKEERLLQQSTQMSTINLPIEQIESVPVILGERDLLKVLAYTPGVSTGAQGTAEISVRGGTPDQNLILLDGATVYNVNHLYGFVSVFNTDALKNVELIKGGFPARYGGRLSSVLDITMKEGSTEKVQGEAGIGAISSRFTINGPIGERTSYLISGRGVYLSLLNLPLLYMYNSGSRATYNNYNFYDVNAKINHKFNDKNRLYFSLYTGHDYNIVKDKSDDEFHFNMDWGNVTGTLRYNRMFTPKLFGKFMLNYSQYKNYFSNIDFVGVGKTSEYNSTSKVRDWSANINFDYLPNASNYIKFGGTAIHHMYKPSLYQIKNEYTTGFDTLNEFVTPAIEMAAYIEDDITLTKWLKINAGFRYSAFYVDEQWYTSPEPRIAARILLQDWAIKGSYSYMQQYIHRLTNNGIGFPSDVWVPSTSIVPPQRAQQVALGLSKTFPEYALDASIETYYKKMENLIEFPQGTEAFFTVDDQWEESVALKGTGEAYGLEFFVHRKKGKLNGWLAYTLSWNNRQFETINQGMTYPANYDGRHDASVVVNYKLTSKLTFSSAWTFKSGAPITLPTASHVHIYPGAVSGIPLEIYPFKNNVRLPSTHRLDIGLDFKRTTKRGRNGTWNFSIYNVYNRANSLYTELSTKYTWSGFEIIDRQRVLRQVGYIPIMPSVSYSLEF